MNADFQDFKHTKLTEKIIEVFYKEIICVYLCGSASHECLSYHNNL